MWSSAPEELKDAVIAAMCRQDVQREVEAIYKDVERELERISPRCAMSGRCCRFEEYGHRLFVTTAELAAFAAAAQEMPAIAPLASRQDGGGCRFQELRLCKAHAIRPLGCRLFFCDESHEQELQVLFEQMHKRLKEVHDRFGITYFYVEWRRGLEVITRLIGD